MAYKAPEVEQQSREDWFSGSLTHTTDQGTYTFQPTQAATQPRNELCSWGRAPVGAWEDGGAARGSGEGDTERCGGRKTENLDRRILINS